MTLATDPMTGRSTIKAMLARPHSQQPGPEVRRTVRGLFGAWRKLLSRQASGASGAARRAERLVREATAGLSERRGAAAADVRRSRAFVTAGAAALLVGAAGRVTLAAALDWPLGSAVLGAGVTLAWAVARYVVMTALRTAEPIVGPSVVAFAWGRGAMPYVMAVTAPMRAVAFAISVYLTYRALIVSGVPARHAATLCAWAFGSEAAAAAGGWVVANGLAALPLLG